MVEKYQTIIENKRSDAVCRKEKDRAWEKIGIEYAALSNIKRSTIELKHKYENIKRQLKKKVTENKIEILKTGGGTAHHEPLTESEKYLHSMLNISVAGLDSNGDSDLSPTTINIEPQPSTSTSNEVETIKIVVNQNKEKEQKSESSEDEEIWESSDDSLDDVDSFSVPDSDSDTSEVEIDSFFQKSTPKVAAY
ncbi:Myb/SANT-like DNA-binding domain [Popillia japonica]|uniref:Regulatory protein zeste n=1 Tax=Popillia japonica TaxID=7064 RepID=A0AAW1L5E4_POPJA